MNKPFLLKMQIKDTIVTKGRVDSRLAFDTDIIDTDAFINSTSVVVIADNGRLALAIRGVAYLCKKNK
jgi:hypothetical protein